MLNFAAFKCDGGRFLCNNGECINQAFVCDGDVKCADGSDEIGCQCLTEQFKCGTSGECVNTRLLCNGLMDCSDGSDEMHCCEFQILAISVCYTHSRTSSP